MDALPVASGTGNEVIGSAAQSDPGGAGGMMGTIIMFGGMFAAMYFFLIRPQRKRDRQQKEMQSALKVGDRIVTSSGMFGKIVSVGGDAFMVEFGDIRGVRIAVRKTDVLGIKTPNMSPTSSSDNEPAQIEDKKDDKKETQKDDKK
jgi:preprotein translocase subunit YajC